MRNHVIFKFLAVALCALCLMGAIVSGGSLVVLAGLGLQDGQSPREKWRADLEDNLQWHLAHHSRPSGTSSDSPMHPHCQWPHRLEDLR